MFGLGCVAHPENMCIKCPEFNLWFQKKEGRKKAGRGKEAMFVYKIMAG